VEKSVRKYFLSVLCFHDATSAMLLNMPGMCSTESSAVWFLCSRTASALRIRAAIGEVLVRNL
jgi:hypothetical protein